MSGKLIVLEQHPSAATLAARENALAVLDKLKARVEAGELTGVAFAACTAEGGACTGWSCGCSDNLIQTLGAVEVLRVRLSEGVDR